MAAQGAEAVGGERSLTAARQQLSRLASNQIIQRVWCGREDSNFHALRHSDLNAARLPIPPRPHAEVGPPHKGGEARERVANHFSRLKRLFRRFCTAGK